MTGKPAAYSYVRMSTVGQAKGDSLRRQLESAQKYAEEHGLEIVSDDELHDIGVSAYRGQNAAEGALGLFLKAVSRGDIPAGSFLLVESLDRLSRQQITKTLTIFLEILRGGITIVTLLDRFVYRPDNPSVADLVYSITVMSRAHDESATKSSRVAAAWANKRARAQDQRITAKCPAWLTPVGKGFELIPDRATIVRRIFDDCRSGMGAYSIARKLNAEKVPTFGGASHWGPSSIKKILTNRATVGEYQMHKIIDGKRVPTGLPLQSYFPPVITEADFFSAQAMRAQLGTTGGGRKGDNFSNLFSAVAVCGYCQAPMHYVNKGKGSKGGNYLVCSGAKVGTCRVSKGWRYRDFEIAFLQFVEELDLPSMLANESIDHKRQLLRDEIQNIQLQIEAAEARQERTIKLMHEVGIEVSAVASDLRDTQAKIETLKSELSKAEEGLLTADQDQVRLNEAKEQILQLIELIYLENDYTTRSKLAARIRTVVSRIHVFAAGTGQADLPALAPLKDKGIVEPTEPIILAELTTNGHPVYRIVRPFKPA